MEGVDRICSVENGGSSILKDIHILVLEALTDLYPILFQSFSRGQLLSFSTVQPPEQTLFVSSLTVLPSQPAPTSLLVKLIGNTEVLIIGPFIFLVYLVAPVSYSRLYKSANARSQF